MKANTAAAAVRKGYKKKEEKVTHSSAYTMEACEMVGWQYMQVR